MRDLDFGRQLVDCLQQRRWPDGVVVEDLSCAAPLVLHRLQELRPPKVVLLGAVPRDLDPPATLRRYRVDLTPPAPADLHRSLEESVMGMVDLDHTLAMARHWGGLPLDTVVIEVEPAETGFGLGFSEELAACFDPILDMVTEELAGIVDDHDPSTDAPFEAEVPIADAADAPPAPVGPSDAVAELVGYARDHQTARFQSRRAPALVDQLASATPGVAIAGRVRPWGVFVESGGDWFDAVPLEGGGLGIVVGNVAGRGVEVAAAMGDLRAAVRAYVVLEGHSPAGLLGRLDQLARTTGLGQDARLLYLTLDPATGEVRFANAGGCPLLVQELDGLAGAFVDAARSAPLGAGEGTERPEGTLRLRPDSTLLLFTDGLVENATIPRATGLERLRRAAAAGVAFELDDLCDHVLTACTGDLRRDDDICLVAVRLTATSSRVDPSPGRPVPSYRSARY